jgi:methylenetetrahydrofolate reductase (NADPH)
MNEIRTDDEKVRSYGVEQCTEMCERLLKLGAPGLHFYTLNLEASVTEILDNLGFLKDCRERRALPWRPSTQDNRRTEEVRPIFWSNRPRSYLARTANWDDFPNGRWGSSFSPTYGELSDYYMFRKFSDPTLQNLRRKQWGAPESTEDVATVFAKFCDGSIDRLPWCELPVQAETGRIAERLIKLNREGYLTINSQPQVNGAHSSDPTVGWGGAGGYVFQKAYLEFFCSRQKLMTLIERMTQLPTVTYHAVNAQGEKFSSFQERNVSALTWGVFPGKEIVQPTVVDSESFMIWKDEAFDLWVSEWRALYEESSRSWEVLTSIHDEYFLVNVVEHDFVNGDLYRIFPEMF